MSTGQSRRVHAIVHGRVQGVNFRASAQREALSLHLSGWVRNLPDGTVETIAEGPIAQLANYVEFLRSGPSAATVSSVTVSWQEASGQFKGFQIEL